MAAKLRELNLAGNKFFVFATPIVNPLAFAANNFDQLVLGHMEFIAHEW